MRERPVVVVVLVDEGHDEGKGSDEKVWPEWFEESLRVRGGFVQTSDV